MWLNSLLSTGAGDHHVHLPDDFAQLDHFEAVHAAQTHADLCIQHSGEKEASLRMGDEHTHHACRAQMGSISVTHTMAPRAFRAVQQPFPTYVPRDSHNHYQDKKGWLRLFTLKRCFLSNNHLSITTHNNLFASKHYVCGPLQPKRDKTGTSTERAAEEANPDCTAQDFCRV